MSEIRVTTSADIINPDDGITSLREAVAEADSGDIITFASELSGARFDLTLGEIVVSQDLTIDGGVDDDPGADIQLDAGGTGRVFKATSGILLLNELTITGGSAEQGGGVFVDTSATVTIANSTVSGNSSDGEGGGVYNAGNLTIHSSTFSGNTAVSDGGGVYNEGVTTLMNTTFHGNAAGRDGGALTSSSDAHLSHVTLTGNTATNYGGGIAVIGDGAVDLTNSLVLGNQARFGAETSGSVSDSGGNLTSGEVAEVFETVSPEGVAELADNGGAVQTVALRLSGSNPALDRGEEISGLTEDAKGQERAVDFEGVENGGIADAGAYELLRTAEEPSLRVTIAENIVDPFDGETSLNEAIEYANRLSDFNEITFASNPGEAFEFGGTILPSDEGFALSRIRTDMRINGDVNGDNTPDVTLDGGEQATIRVEGGSQVELVSLNITGLYSTLSGPIYVEETSEGEEQNHLIVRFSSVYGNTAAINASAIENHGVLELLNSTVFGNTVDGNGGAGSSLGIAIVNSGTAVIKNSTISGNSSPFEEGSAGIGNSGELTIRNSTITGHSKGGVRAGDAGNADISASVILGNAFDGGANVIGEFTAGDRNILSGDPEVVFANVDSFGSGQLADNGGPVPTIALSSNFRNPALDVARDFSDLEFDANGQPRVVDLNWADNGGVIDAGAVELQQVDIPGLIRGTPENDTISGTADNDRILGLQGNDLIEGMEGDDELLGQDGSDTINGGDGNDTILGGYDEIDLRDVIYAGAGNDSVDSGYGNDLVYGQDGNDTIAGGFGVDELQGQDGDDVITGSAYSDLVFGGAGNDFVNGGFGHDRINGGSGADKFYHVGVEGHGSDWVQDYAAADGDVLLWGGSAGSVSDFQVNFAHTENDAGERSGDDTVQEGFVIYKPTGQIIWALVDGQGQDQINLQIGSEVFDLLA